MKAFEQVEKISIHAPAWGATRGRPFGAALSWISIHAPAWGATILFYIPSSSVTISIHAPAWGATAVLVRDELLFLFQSTRPRGARQGGDRQGVHAGRDFNPRARVGRDYIPLRDRPEIADFNPRARVGRDHIVPHPLGCKLNFNPRARVGRDLTSTS